ncbi:MAG: tRNA (adenosine(37)-N6)-dimethylallyltransferase MiaA [Gammaproteobacteria bacterium]|nr:tRNA (adenosine(37)-N6)-dimethylallyltransferase MiaA [Gammaproteobacteria bacterium]
MGPTAAGKTDAAITLCEHFPFEIVSVDSAMVYRDLDIGTAKPTVKQLQLAKHHLIDICDPKESYSAGEFRHDALQKIEEIFARGNIPLLVGGTMLYFYVLQHGLSNLPKADEKVRLKIQAECDQLGLGALYDRLQNIDPQSAKNIKKTDSQRIQRALEVHELTGKSLTELKLIDPPCALPYEVINFIISPSDISAIRGKIQARFNQMLHLGFVDEVQKLYQRGDLYADLPSIRSVGYRQIWQYLSGQISYDKMLELIPIVTGRLAKRQLTWLRRWDRAKWFNSDDPMMMSNIMNSIDFCLR